MQIADWTNSQCFDTGVCLKQLISYMSIFSADLVTAAHTSTNSQYQLIHTHSEWCTYLSVNYATIGSDNGLSPIRRQSHYLNQFWIIVNLTPRYMFQWNCIWKSGLCVQQNSFENVVCKMASICLGLSGWNTSWIQSSTYRRCCNKSAHFFTVQLQFLSVLVWQVHYCMYLLH